MSSCECCWADKQRREFANGDRVSYADILTEHADRNCVCVQSTPEGDRARAGQFWDEERKRDVRASLARASEVAP